MQSICTYRLRTYRHLVYIQLNTDRNLYQKTCHPVHVLEQERGFRLTKKVYLGYIFDF